MTAVGPALIKFFLTVTVLVVFATNCRKSKFGGS
jgi:hypothetical protein